nr:probable palmitoyltransferase ZDHHC19 [Pelodiscus sinensis]|eukprot:XP_025045225.1 probable palmitoyltransferase ZDHHC19 [Pelodiscus sinensis]
MTVGGAVTVASTRTEGTGVRPSLQVPEHFLFVAFLCAYDLLVLASCLTYLALNARQAYGPEKICAIVVTIPAALYLLPLLILVGSQASFITLAQRTYELKLREMGRGNPFDLGWARNWYAALCAPRGPSGARRAPSPPPAPEARPPGEALV